jgi:hypothetical protein
LSKSHLTSTNFSSRTIPQGAESDIDICSLEFEMPVYISPPAKVKKLGIVQSIVANVFTEEGDVVNLENLISGELWNDTELAEPDFMHFQSAGHRKLAQKLYKEIISIKN